MKYLDENKKQYILNSLPEVELYNEQKIHNKANYEKYDFYRLIPKGKKGLLVFTQNKNNYYTYFVEIYNKKCTNVIEFITSFKTTLTCGKMGTILYGTLNNYNEQNTFIVEDVLYFKHKNVINSNWGIKYSILSDIFNNYINPSILLKSQLLIMMSFTDEISKNDPYNIINEYIKDYYFSIYTIQYFNDNDTHVSTCRYVSNNIIKGIFKITPHIQNDIYEGYDSNNNSIGILCIPDYKTSVMLNSYFRIIKENINLDSLEESDDEEEFENTDLDKHVYLEKIGIYECVYSTNFNMWVPVKFISDNSSFKIDNIETIMNKIDKNNKKQQFNRNKYNQQFNRNKYNKGTNKKYNKTCNNMKYKY